MLGKTIRIYLVDGKPSGILSAEIINWTGSVLVSPRSNLSDLAKREEVRRTGIYDGEAKYVEPSAERQRSNEQ